MSCFAFRTDAWLMLAIAFVVTKDKLRQLELGFRGSDRPYLLYRMDAAWSPRMSAHSTLDMC